MYLSGVKRARKNEEVARTIHEINRSDSIKYINDLKRADEKNEMQTALWFVTEIERSKALIDRLSKTGNLGDVKICEFHKDIIENKTKAMEAKFSEEEIAKARLIFASKPNPFIFDGNQK